jgi:hypothetical protein
VIFATQEILRETEQACEAITGIDIMLDHIEREIIDPTETPDYETQEQEVAEAEVLGQEQRGGGRADEQEETGFEVDGALAPEVTHY